MTALGSFKAAAVELHVTPTAISHQVRLLERTCGQRLFHRHPKPLELTGVGASLYPGLRDSFDALVSAVASIAETGTPVPLRVTSPNAFASRWLVPRLPDWRAQHPGIPLEVIGTDAVLDLRALSFREELHAIDAVVAGQGIAICSDVVVGHELKSGTLVKAHPLSLPGYGFYVVALHESMRRADIEAFAAWMGAADRAVTRGP